MPSKKIFLFVVLILPAVSAIGADDTYKGFAAYLLPWRNMLMNSERPEEIRKYASLKMQSNDDLYVNGLAAILKIDSVLTSRTRYEGSFTPHLILDFYTKTGVTISFISDGARLCTLDLNHCVSVDDEFKRRFDPVY